MGTLKLQDWTITLVIKCSCSCRNLWAKKTGPLYIFPNGGPSIKLQKIFAHVKVLQCILNMFIIMYEFIHFAGPIRWVGTEKMALNSRQWESLKEVHRFTWISQELFSPWPRKCILLLPPPRGIAIHHVCWFVGLYVRSFVSIQPMAARAGRRSVGGLVAVALQAPGGDLRHTSAFSRYKAARTE